jgi:hypothetical protein
MAYDVHIVRTDTWFDAANDPITKRDVDELIASDSELEWSADDWVDMRDGRGKKVTRYFMILWQGQPCFWWYRDQIKCAGPTEEQVGKMVGMAAKLRAKVLGDDGEAYRPGTWQAAYRGEVRE